MNERGLFIRIAQEPESVAVYFEAKYGSKSIGE